MSNQTFADRPVDSLQGVGPKTVAYLEKLGIRSVQDLLFHTPIRYEDRTRIQPIGQLRPGQRVLVEGRVERSDLNAGRRRSLICRINDGSGHLTVRFFHFGARQGRDLSVGVRLRCFGEVRSGFTTLEMVHPEYERVDAGQSAPVGACLTPVYPLTDGLHQKTLRRLVVAALALLEGDDAETALPDLLPSPVQESMALLPLGQALHRLHAPPADSDSCTLEACDHGARNRLAFEELLAHHLSLTGLHFRARARRAPILRKQPEAELAFLARLPFDLTRAQRRVIADIQTDLSSSSPMMRLLQGDVGSGKTVVAACCALTALASGYQVALMAPTELLAEQHHRNFDGWLGPSGGQVVCLTGKHKGIERTHRVQSVQRGEAGVVIGTHALFQDAVQFSRLGLVIIDEQHRFGVQQRLALRTKGLGDGLHPHQLIMTATPIPRTLAMLNFADATVSVLDELPPGRRPVQTRVICASRRCEVIRRTDQWVKNGGQVYWVCTLIEESEVLQCEAAEASMAKLCKALPNVRIAVLHGRLKPVEKASALHAFKERQVDLLVATTVIEVGVDVPGAGLMIIENSERLGLSQLHQLRGRVGRSTRQSFCVLMYQNPLSEQARQRLAVMRNSNDGFAIAEQDLELRGAGEVLGTRQTGRIAFRIADLARDKALLPQVLRAAKHIQQNHPHCVQPLIRRWLGATTDFADV